MHFRLESLYFIQVFKKAPRLFRNASPRGLGAGWRRTLRFPLPAPRSQGTLLRITLEKHFSLPAQLSMVASLMLMAIIDHKEQTFSPYLIFPSVYTLPA